MADYQSIYEGQRMDELWTLAGQAVQGIFVTTGGQEVEAEKDENGKVHLNIGYLSLFRYDPETNTIYAGDSDHPVNFAAFGEVTAGGIGGDTPTPGSGTLGGLVNVVAEADNPQLTDKILVRRAGQSVTHWTLADLSSIAGAVAGVRINGVDKAPDANKIVDLGTGWATETFVGANFLATTLKGANNGLAELGADGKVPSSQLPSYVDDVLEFATHSAFPATGESGKIYVALDTNKTYRWGGTEYVEISASLALGETASTAYRGDRGKIAYDHSQATGNPHNTTLANIVGQTLADKLTALAGWFAEDENGNIYLTKNGTADRSFWAYGEITAGGVGTGGGGGAAVWGGIEGTLSNQTDLWNVLQGKQASLGTGTNGQILSWQNNAPAWVAAPATGVTTFNNRSGAVTLSSTDVTTALGYTPVNKAGDTITGVLYPSSDSAIDLGSATRKWHYGYFHRLLRLTSITTSDTYNTNMITVPAKAGTMALTSDIASSLGNYLPLTGGTLSASNNILSLNSSTSNAYIYFKLSNTNKAAAGYYAGLAFVSNETTYARIGVNDAGVPQYWGSSSASTAQTLYHTGNLTHLTVTGLIGNTTYAPYNANGYLPLTGGTMSGTISIVGLNALYTWDVNYNYGGWARDAFQLMQKGTKIGAIGAYGDPDFRYLYFGCNGYNGLNLRINATELKWGNNPIYHSGNCNNASTPWSASSLTLNGAINGATSINSSYLVSSASNTEIHNAGNAILNILGVSDAVDYMHLYITGGGNNSRPLVLQNGYGNVGIGTTSPSEKLDVSGRAVAGVGGEINPLFLRRARDGKAYYIIGSKGSSGIDAYTMRIWNQSDQGMSVDLINGTMTANGNIVATGEVTAGSDARWKHNITPVHNGISAIMKLQPSEWEWNSDNHKGSGLIAQQVQSVLSHLVKTDGEGYLHLTYDGLHAYEISAIQYHETEIDRLRRRVAELERQLNIN